MNRHDQTCHLGCHREPTCRPSVYLDSAPDKYPKLGLQDEPTNHEARWYPNSVNKWGRSTPAVLGSYTAVSVHSLFPSIVFYFFAYCSPSSLFLTLSLLLVLPLHISLKHACAYLRCETSIGPSLAHPFITIIDTAHWRDI
ncbi:hypothetical protein P168DRAFT_95564 [Aspergillus campestris IBT 28561]|uniref:Uncharacterized protein n=1 Tax=Aspergillus campestris (strain IBT 28561) TaxID=1392248 RepID=A0A2I1DC14_ASPC2|nr:uncharacterized protein P168DRAFT_95564 [Aspergillus campestris IBT 28561]PKY07404.1 hypothetical protein P168DRAFT_95564 [Aspergillus campestris IBT 28561]